MAKSAPRSEPAADDLPRCVLAVRGREAAHFLQDVVSADVTQLKNTEPLYGLLLTPQGRLRYDFFLWRGKDQHSFYLDCERRSAAGLQRALLFYRLRRAIEIALVRASVSAFWGRETAPAGARADPRHPALGWRMLRHKSSRPSATRAAAYRRHRLSLGVPEGAGDMPPARSFPLEYGLQYLQALDFRKGCFIGQEVAARGHRRGARRKSLYPLRFAAKAPAAGTPICTADGRVMGEVRAAAGTRAIALLRSDALEQKLTAAGQVFTRLAPLWEQAAAAQTS